MTIPTVSKGEVFRPTATTWNAFVRAANMNDLGGRKKEEDTTSQKETPTLTVQMLFDNAAVTRREVVGLTTPAILPTEGQQWFEQRQQFGQAGQTFGAFGLTTKAYGPDIFGLVVSSGIVETKLFVPTDGAWITRADIDTGDATRLLSTPNGSAQILWKSSGTNQEVDAIVRLGTPQDVSLPGVVDSPGVSAGGTGTVSIWQDVSGTMTDTGFNIAGVKLNWMHNSEAISTGKQVLIKWFASEQIWRFIGAECEA